MVYHHGALFVEICKASVASGSACGLVVGLGHATHIIGRYCVAACCDGGGDGADQNDEEDSDEELEDGLACSWTASDIDLAKMQGGAADAMATSRTEGLERSQSFTRAYSSWASHTRDGKLHATQDDQAYGRARERRKSRIRALLTATQKKKPRGKTLLDTVDDVEYDDALRHVLIATACGGGLALVGSMPFLYYWHGKRHLYSLLREGLYATLLFSAVPLTVAMVTSGTGTHAIMRKLPTCLAVVVLVNGGISAGVIALQFTHQMGHVAALEWMRGCRIASRGMCAVLLFGFTNRYARIQRRMRPLLINGQEPDRATELIHQVGITVGQIVGNVCVGTLLYSALADLPGMRLSRMITVFPMYCYLLVVQVCGEYPSPDHDKKPRNAMLRTGYVGMAAAFNFPQLSQGMGYETVVVLKMMIFFTYAAWFSTYQEEWEANLVPPQVRAITRAHMGMMSEDLRARCFYRWAVTTGVAARISLHGSYMRQRSMGVTTEASEVRDTPS